MSTATDFDAVLRGYRHRVDQALPQFLPKTDSAPTRLAEAMHYAVTNGGKRVRPVLTYATAKAIGLALDKVDAIACAVEMVHAYSLVHDDLPAMDDDDLRRGKPTVHKAFDEATAILAGDALQALAFNVLADASDESLSAESRVAILSMLGKASGVEGMALGQAIDLEAVGRQLTLEELENMHRHKTGALIKASVLMPVEIVHLADKTREQLSGYADAIGLSFQIVDDILDVIADTETLGKQQGADKALNKPTYPALLGLDGARQHAEQTHQRALASLGALGPEYDELRALSAYILERSY